MICFVYPYLSLDYPSACYQPAMYGPPLNSWFVFLDSISVSLFTWTACYQTFACDTSYDLDCLCHISLLIPCLDVWLCIGLPASLLSAPA